MNTGWEGSRDKIQINNDRRADEAPRYQRECVECMDDTSKEGELAG